MKPRYLLVQSLLVLCLVTTSALAEVAPIRPGTMADGGPLLRGKKPTRQKLVATVAAPLSFCDFFTESVV